MDNVEKYCFLRNDLEEIIKYLMNAAENLNNAAESLNSNFKINNISASGEKIKQQQNQLTQLAKFIKNNIIPSIEQKIRNNGS